MDLAHRPKHGEGLSWLLGEGPLRDRGTKEELKSLVKACHGRGVWVMSLRTIWVTPRGLTGQPHGTQNYLRSFTETCRLLTNLNITILAILT